MSGMTNPSDEQPQVELNKPVDPPPTQPMYGQGSALPPTHSAYGHDSGDQADETKATGQSPYGQTYGQTPYGQQPPPPASAYQGYGQQPGYGTPPPMPYGQSPYGGVAGVQDSSATTAMVLGIVGLASVVLCAGALLILSPVALFMGRASRNRIDASNGALRGRGEAQAGFVTGIIGTVMLGIGVIVLILVVIIGVVASSSDDNYGTTDNGYSSNA